MGYLAIIDDVEESLENTKTAKDFILAAYRGELRQAALLQPLPKWREALGGEIWLVPDRDTQERIRRTDRRRLVLTAEDFFKVCELVYDKGEQARGVVEALRLFGGEMRECGDDAT